MASTEPLEANECPICYEPTQCVLPCAHTYCVLCISKIDSCALCRKPVHDSNIYSLHDIDTDEHNKNFKYVVKNHHNRWFKNKKLS